MPLALRSRTLPPTMPQDASQQTPPPAPTSCPGVPRIRDPPVFTGADGTDVEDWLALYERVSLPNKWDEAGKLTNLVFYVVGVVQQPRIRFYDVVRLQDRHYQRVWPPCRS